MKKNALSCIGYARSAVVDGTPGQGSSIEQQASEITHAVEHDGTLGARARLMDVVTDAGRPATDTHRPGLAKLLRTVRRGGVDAVVVTRLDRLTRSVEHSKELLKEFERRGVRLVSLEEVVHGPRRGRRNA
jgi:DNA invertase Pin-like site-specific DNA recombinase